MHVQRERSARGEHVVQPFGAHDVCDLVRIGDYGGGSVRKHGAREFRGGDERAFQVNVRIDKSRKDDRIGHVIFDFAGIFADSGDQALGHGDIAANELVAEYV